MACELCERESWEGEGHYFTVTSRLVPFSPRLVFCFLWTFGFSLSCCSYRTPRFLIFSVSQLYLFKTTTTAATRTTHTHRLISCLSPFVSRISLSLRSLLFSGFPLSSLAFPSSYLSGFSLFFSLAFSPSILPASLSFRLSLSQSYISNGSLSPEPHTRTLTSLCIEFCTSHPTTLVFQLERGLSLYFPCPPFSYSLPLSPVSVHRAVCGLSLPTFLLPSQHHLCTSCCLWPHARSGLAHGGSCSARG